MILTTATTKTSLKKQIIWTILIYILFKTEISWQFYLVALSLKERVIGEENNSSEVQIKCIFLSFGIEEKRNYLSGTNNFFPQQKIFNKDVLNSK